MKKKSFPKYILGIQCFASIDSGACIVKTSPISKNYEYVAISEERLIRKKYPYTFPLHSIKYCMDYFNLKNFNQIDLLVSDIIREPKWLRSGPSFNVKEFDYIKSILKISKKKIFQINHHLAHAASVYYTSGFKNSAILIVDGNGTDLETNSFFEGLNKQIKLIDKYKARGIGAVYNIITTNCLNLGQGGEGKTMGLAPYGRNGKKVLDFSKVQFNGIVTDYSSVLKRMPFSDILYWNKNKDIQKFATKLKKRRKNQNIMNIQWRKIAFDLQNEAERCVIHLGKEIQKKIKSKNICIAGGVALNSVANQKLFDATKFKNIFVYPACSDAGVPFGLAIWAVYNHRYINKSPIRLKKLVNAYTGKKYNNEYISNLIKKNNIEHEIMSLSEVAKLISKKKIIGWFQNGSEYGPRALGNRSILADSRSSKIRNYVNKKVKHRELYRPFAPAVLEEDCKRYFKLKNSSPYMLLVAKVRNPKRIPAVTHVDGTARVQTVNKEQNRLFYNLIYEFKKITGVGCILNTSFNDAGEPIVETPEDALITFLGTKMDYLVLGNYLINRKKINNKLREKLIKLRKKKIDLEKISATKLLTNNYRIKNKKNYFIKEEKKAYWSCLFKAYEDLNKKLKSLKNNKTKTILYGTYDQTNILFKKFKDFKSLNLIGFLPYGTNSDDLSKKAKLNFNLPLINKNSKLLKEKNVEVLITSYEFLYDIERDLNQNYPSIKYFKFYTSYSRNLKDFDILKKIIK